MKLWHAMTAAALAIGAAGCQPKEPSGESTCTCTCRFDSRLPAGGAVAATAPATAVAPAAAPATVVAPAAPPARVPVGDRILIGHVGTMTGDQSSHGESVEKGIKLALDEQNQKGGIKGKQLVLKTADSQGKPDGAAAAATQLIQERATVLLGDTSSGRSLAMAPLADANQIPMVSPTSTNAKVTKDGDKTRPYVFRVCFIDPFQGTAMAKFAREVLKIYQVAVLRNPDDPYSSGLAESFTTKFKEMGGSVILEQNYKTGDQDFKAQLSAIKSRNPEAVYLPGAFPEVPRIAVQARTLGVKAPFLGGDAWFVPKLYEAAQGALDGSYYSTHYSDQDPAPVIQDFVRKFKAVYGAAPDQRSVLAYDAAKVAFQAMERARDLSGPAIREALETTQGFPGVSGVITLDADHNALKPAVVLSIDKSAAYYAATITP